MIQRKQSLFLLELAFLAIALLFIPSQHYAGATSSFDVYLIPLDEPDIASTGGHYTAIGINFAGLVLSFITLFLYNKRKLQVKLSYFLTLLWLVLTLMIAFCPFGEPAGQNVGRETNYFAVVIGVFAMVAGLMAARFIKKDIELLKSADRIR